MSFLVGLVIAVLFIALIGFLVNLITTKIPMDDSIKQLIIVMVVLAVVIYVLILLTGNASLPTLPFVTKRL